MKKILTAAVICILLVGATSVYAGEPAGAVPDETLLQMGLEGMTQVADAEGDRIRAKSFGIHSTSLLIAFQKTTFESFDVQAFIGISKTSFNQVGFVFQFEQVDIGF